MNFCKTDEEKSGRELFLDTDELTFFGNGSDMSDLACMAGLFPSRNQARKNGYSGYIPSGWSEHGSKKNRFYIWNPQYDDHVWKHPCWKIYDLTEEGPDWSTH